jgi:hypothetical protein
MSRLSSNELYSYPNVLDHFSTNDFYKKGIFFINGRIKDGSNLNNPYRRMKYIMYACKESFFDMFYSLVKSGAYLESIIRSRHCLRYACMTVIMQACRKKDIRYLDILIKNGANLDAQDSSGRTPLMYAYNFGCTKRLNMLIESGASLNIRDNCNRTIFARAFLMKKTPMREYLLRYLQPKYLSALNMERLMRQILKSHCNNTIRKIIDIYGHIEICEYRWSPKILSIFAQIKCEKVLSGEISKDVVENIIIKYIIHP